MSSELSLLPGERPPYFDESSLQGILSEEEIKRNIERLQKLDVDEYIRQTVLPTENLKRRSAPEAIKALGGKLVKEELDGPLYIAELEFVSNKRLRRFGFIAQNRKNQAGVWYPQHHLKAADAARFFASHSMPLITFMDTPGAASDAEANLNNQAHSISFFITEMANLEIPTVGIVFGQGYSGGAIGLATTNILLSVRDGVFNTIYPKGLSNIARKYNLSWEECAQYIGVSAYELHGMGYFDGILDYTPDEPHLLHNLKNAIFSAIECIEENSKKLLRSHGGYFWDHYQESLDHYLNPSEMLLADNTLTDKTPSGILNIFGDVNRFLRFLKLRHKIKSQSILTYSRLSTLETPKGRLQERMAAEQKEKFRHWLESPVELRYQEDLYKKYKRFSEAFQNRENERGRFVAFFIGDPKEKFETSIKEFISETLLYLYNYWKENAVENLTMLYEHLKNTKPTKPSLDKDLTLLEALTNEHLQQSFIRNFQNIILFDLLYDGVMNQLPMIAGELNGTNQISEKSVARLFESSFDLAIREIEARSLGLQATDAKERFFKWLRLFITQKNCDQIMQTISDWKQRAFPRLSPPLFGLVRYYFSSLLPSLNVAVEEGKKFNGKITPRNIGIKDFWNRLDRAYKDLLIQNLLRDYKKNPITPKSVIDYFFEDFEELFKDRITTDPVRFPGLRQAVESALEKDIAPSAIVTGLATYVDGEQRNKVGLAISNTQFQAGAFDMASCEKLCRLLAKCTEHNLPVIMFISAGGMLTKEGAGALFSMPVLNDRITRFVKDSELPVICFGFRDCVGGAQASFVTHRLVKTYFFSGTTMSFAGQLVVESHLPTNATLSNYLSTVPGSMDGLVHNPFDEAIDAKMKEIDPQIPLAQLTVKEVVSRILAGEYHPHFKQDEVIEKGSIKEKLHLRPVKRMLIHARGCTATRLILAAHANNIEVVLVQSDPDMDSFPTRLLKKNDRLICLGGNTAQESYLNAMSVILIAEQEEADSIHPGIGFLSEHSTYAKVCREHGFNFIGPTANSMDMMGNKSNALATAKHLKIPVVPGSEGALIDPSQAIIVAEEIGFPVLIKATHGGGGKGIRVVDEAESFKDIFSQMSQEALGAFGNGDLYLEKYIVSMRHVEVQILRDTHGNTKMMGMRDCTVQRNYQKLIEESADDTIPKHIADQLYGYSQAIIDEIDYIGAGTVEFIYDRTDQKVYFMEMNTRLQVEHTVSEMVTGVDLVQQQLKVAEGESIEELSFEIKGHSIELRITAEKIEINSDHTISFLPDPGKVTEVAFPAKENVRVISAIRTNSVVPPFYDSLVAQIVAWGESREIVIQTLLKYLEKVRITGISTNLALSKAILENETFQSGNYDTRFLNHFLKEINTDELLKSTKRYAGDIGTAIDQQTISIPDSKELKVLSPQTGSFYRASSPDDPTFVEEGQKISVDQTLCLLESMKVFNELTLLAFKGGDGELLYPAASSYQIKKIIPEDRQTVSRGDLLFVIEPTDHSHSVSK
ncbi:MAG: ATP-grasp domain-containing protein [SAR324 cluster bacterium]|nr:ATP-grasp domain-containing protein [SAR324 cluster bacterium]